MTIGDIIDGRYLVEQALGEGGMAKVFRVRHVGLGSVHALKVLNPDLAARPEVRTRFAAEGQIQAQVRHPNLVAVTEIVAQPELYGLVMDYVEGSSLDRYLAGRAAPPEAEEVRHLFGQVLEGMAFAHRAGIVHRDLKPENILIGRDVRGRPWPRVTDFGIAKVRQAAEGGERATRTGMSMGTRGYMSPEQIKSSRDVDLRSDVFALGATLYELATLKQAFPGESEYEVMDRIVHERYLPPEEAHPGIDPALAAAIRVALRADPAARFESCEAFLAALEGGPLPADTQPSAPAHRAAPLAAVAPPASPAPAGEAAFRATRPGAASRPEPAPAPASDTAPDGRLLALDPETFEPVQAAPEPAASPLALALAPEPAPAEEAARVAERVRAWAAGWPEPLRRTLTVAGVERVPALLLSLEARFERRELKARELPYPGGAAAPLAFDSPEGLDPWRLGLPAPEAAAESFVVEGSVAVRPCAACRAQGGRPCLACEGQGGTRCVVCSGSGKAGCVLCDGAGKVRSPRGGFETCPSCRGLGEAACAAPGCLGGSITCPDCGGEGQLPCPHCKGKGSLARALVVVRGSRTAAGEALASPELPDPVRAALLALTEAGEPLGTAAGAPPELGGEPRVVRALARATGRAEAALPPGQGYRPGLTRVKVHRLPLHAVRFAAGGREGLAWVVGGAGRVVSEASPAEAWAADRAARARALAEAGDVAGLRALEAEGPLPAGLGPVLAQAAVARFEKGEVAAARAVRDGAPAALAAPVTAAVAEREAGLGRTLARRTRLQYLGGLLLGSPLGALVAAGLHAEPLVAAEAGLALALLGWLPLWLLTRWRPDLALRRRAPLVAAALLPALGSLAAPALAPGCPLGGRWTGGPERRTELVFERGPGGALAATVVLAEPGRVREVVVRGSCEAGSGLFELRGDAGTLKGRVEPGGREVRAAWRAKEAKGPAAEFPYARK